jgi:RNA polymerase sigma-70 factor (ECF subfamily)
LEAASKNIHQELIEKCRKNDRNAQLEIYKLYYRPMYNTSFRILNHEAEAEDVMQESFLDAFRKISEYKGEGNFGGWLRRIVVNNSIDALKKRKDLLPLEDSVYDLADENNGYMESVEYRVDEIKKAIVALAEEHRIILSLFLFEGYDHDEISQILNISNNASRTRYSRARVKLLKLLADQRTIKMFHPN